MGTLPRADPNSAVGTIWTDDVVCDGSTGAGYTVTAAQSGATTTYEFDVLCGEIATFANPTSGHHKHRQQNQQQQRRRHRRAQRKHNQSGTTVSSATPTYQKSLNVRGRGMVAQPIHA